MILVVGATGQVGTAVVRRLVARDEAVRALVRPTSDHETLTRLGVDLAFGDLRTEASVRAACEGVDVVVATASAAVPRRGDDLAAVEDAGYRNLFDACEAAGVEQVVYLSVPESPVDGRAATTRYKRRNEVRLLDSGLTYTVVRAAPFMDIWFAAIGSSLPLRGAEHATLDRPFWGTRLTRRLTGTLVEKRGLALVPGAADRRHAFVSVDDVAAFLVACIGHADAENAVLDFGGPEAVSWREVVETYEAILGREVRAVYVPTVVLAALQRTVGLVLPTAGNLLGMARSVAASDTDADPVATDAIMSVPRTSVEQFLRERAELPDYDEMHIKRDPAVGTGAA